MAIIKKEIFLASRFEEFKEIRTRLAKKIEKYPFMEAIDLNDNQASHRSPLEESLFHVRKAEIMILLVGETYGTVPEGEEKSYTHLEYAEALKESSNTRILIFCIGDAYAGQFIEYSKTDEKMKAWQLELEKNHRLSKFGNKDLVEEITENIMIMLLSSVYDLNPDENLFITQDEELYLDDMEEDENFLHDDEAEFLDNKLSEQQEIGITDVDDDIEGFDLLKIPGKLAALEQKKEAQVAIEIQDYYTARVHLKKALELRPLDFETNYWLAKLYVASAKKNLFFEIEEYLLRAAKIALQDNNRFKASHCYQLIIQASIFSDKENEGLKYIELAEDITPNFARLYYEKAKYMLYFGHDTQAKQALVQAMNIRMDILKDVLSDPFFLQYKFTINEVKMDMKSHLKKSCYAIASQSNEMKKIFGMDIDTINIDKLSIYSLWKYARSNFLSQYRLLKTQISVVESNKLESLEEELNDLQEIEKIDVKYLRFQYDTIRQSILDIVLKHKKEMDAISFSMQYLGGFTAILIGILIFNRDKELSFMAFPLFLVLFFGGLFFYYSLKKKKENTKYKQYLSDKIDSIQKDINNLNKYYNSVKSAFEVFEFNTVSKSSSKLVPLKSLNNASVGSIVRVTPFSYKKYMEKGNSIKILEDFPECLEVDNVDIDKNSFLGKVLKKNYNSIVLSRFKAY